MLQNFRYINNKHMFLNTSTHEKVSSFCNDWKKVTYSYVHTSIWLKYLCVVLNKYQLRYADIVNTINKNSSNQKPFFVDIHG